MRDYNPYHSANAAAALTSVGMDPGCFLIDFACYKPDDRLKVDAREMEEHGKQTALYTEDRRDFMWKVYVKSGLGPSTTYLPETVHFKYNKVPKSDVNSSLAEGFEVMTGAVDEVLGRLNLDPRDIDILLTSNSIFCHTPSLASMLVNHYGMRSDVASYHCGGMGCSNGTIGVGLARDMLKAHPNSVCLLVFCEILSHSIYLGFDKSRMVANVIFRMGGAAAVLSNRADLVRKAKYRLEHCVRCSTAASDESFRSVKWGPDRDGFNGMYLDKAIIREAGICLEQCIRRITPKIMTWQQYCEAAAFYTQSYLKSGGSLLGSKIQQFLKDQLKFPAKDSTSFSHFPAFAFRSFLTSVSSLFSSGPPLSSSNSPSNSSNSPSTSPPPSADFTTPIPPSVPTQSHPTYLPDFTKCVDHFLIHAGGYSVLKGLQEGLRIPASAMIPSYASLRDYGNTSASTTWYAFGYTEACQGVRQGDRVLQMGVGGGMKGGVNTWRALRGIDGREHTAWRHLKGVPLRECDLPRGVEVGDIRNHQEARIVEEIERREKVETSGRGRERGKVEGEDGGEKERGKRKGEQDKKGEKKEAEQDKKEEEGNKRKGSEQRQEEVAEKEEKERKEEERKIRNNSNKNKDDFVNGSLLEKEKSSTSSFLYLSPVVSSPFESLVTDPKTREQKPMPEGARSRSRPEVGSKPKPKDLTQIDLAPAGDEEELEVEGLEVNGVEVDGVEVDGVEMEGVEKEGVEKEGVNLQAALKSKWGATEERRNYPNKTVILEAMRKMGDQNGYLECL